MSIESSYMCAAGRMVDRVTRHTIVHALVIDLVGSSVHLTATRPEVAAAALGLSPTAGFGKSWEARVDGLHVTVTGVREKATA